MKKLFFPVVIAVFFVLYYSCTKDKTVKPDCTGINPQTNTYTFNIQNILDMYCAISSCHDAATAQFGIDLSNYNSTVTAFETKNVICSVEQTGCTAMPLNGRKLQDTLITEMVCWAANGYPQ